MLRNREQRSKGAHFIQMHRKDINGVSVILPCLNEEQSIRQAIEAARRGIAKLGLPDAEVIVVDNGSVDNSALRALEAGARVVHEERRGYGSALRRGFKEARFPLMIMGDSDLSYDFEKIDELAGPILEGRADFVIGNRMRDIKPGAMPGLHRYLGNPVLSLMLRILFRSNAVHDAHCGLRAITREAYDRLKCVATGMEFASEMVIRAIRCGLRIAERDITYHPRMGESKLRSFTDGWRHVRFMLLHSPTMLLLAPGAFFWLLGLAAMLWLPFAPIRLFGLRLTGMHSMLFAGLLNMVSLQILTIGMLAKAYGHLSGLHEDVIVAWLYRRFNFETAILISAPAVLFGLAVTAVIFVKWVASGGGSLDHPFLLFFAVVCLVNGVQLAAAAYLCSIMALHRHIDRLPPSLEDIGQADL